MSSLQTGQGRLARVRGRALAAAGIVLLLAGCGVLAGCGSTSLSTSSPAGSGSPGSPGSSPTARAGTLASVVPAAHRGSTVYAALNVYQPYEIYSNNAAVFTGIDPELYQAMGRLLGITFQIHNVPFNEVVPGIQAGRYQVSSPLGDFVQRQQVVTFVDYARGASSLLVSSSSTFRPTAVMDLCGRAIGIETGTAESTVTQDISHMCTAAGKQPLAVHQYADESSITLALASGRLDGGLSDAAPNSYTAKQSGGQFVNLPISGGSAIPGWGATFGIAVPKGSWLAPTILAAMKELRGNGTYSSIFNQWDLSLEMLPASAIKINGSKQQEG
jgi:polar amino acid transport system substrate-binding protein